MTGTRPTMGSIWRPGTGCALCCSIRTSFTLQTASCARRRTCARSTANVGSLSPFGKHRAIGGYGRDLPADNQYQGEARRSVQDLQVSTQDREAARAAQIHARGGPDLVEEEHACRGADVPRVPRADGCGTDRARVAAKNGREQHRSTLLLAGRPTIKDADHRPDPAPL